MRVILILLVLNLQACAVYSVASVGSYAVSGKGLTDHAASLASGGDCNALKHLYQGRYTCEMPPVYNRSGI